MNRIVIRSALLLGALFFTVHQLAAQGTAFTYQGRMNDNGGAATGAYDLRFALYDAATNGTAISQPQTNAATGITNGLFTSTLDFGSVFTGTNYWLALGVRTNGNTNAFTLLWPRQSLAPVPYAVFANSASNLLGRLAATQLTGTLPSAQVSGNYTGSVNFTNSTNSFTGTFFGNGSALTTLNASNLSFGTVADVRLTTNVALLDHNQIFTGTNIFTNRYNSFVGSFFGNGLVGWQVITGTVQQANINSGYVLTSSNLTTLTLPTNAIVGDIVRISGAGSGGWKIAQNAGQSVAGNFYTATNATWIQSTISSLGWQAIASSADGLKMVASAASGSGIYISTDSGRTWASSSSTYSPTSLASSDDGSRLVGATRNGGVIISANSGATWSLITPGNVNWSGITISADGSKFAACISNSTVYAWSNYGAISNFPAAPLTAPLSGIACSADGLRLVTAAYGAGIYLSTDSGATWSTTTAPSANWTSIASSADGYRLVAVINGGKIYTSADGGASWTAQANSPTALWSAVTSSSDGGRIAAVVNTNNASGLAGVAYISANFGQTWTIQNIPALLLRGVAMSNDGSKVAVISQITINTGSIYYWQGAAQNTTSTSGTNGAITGSFGSAVELQFIGGGRFMPVSSSGIFWAN